MSSFKLFLYHKRKKTNIPGENWCNQYVTSNSLFHIYFCFLLLPLGGTKHIFFFFYSTLSLFKCSVHPHFSFTFNVIFPCRLFYVPRSFEIFAFNSLWCSLNKHCHRWTVFIATYFKQNKDSPYENLFCQQIVSRHDFIFIHWFPTDFKCTIISIVSSNATWWSKTLPLNVIVLRWIISSKIFQQILRISMVCFWQKNYWHLDLRFSRWQLDSHIAVQPHTHILAEWVCEH